MREGGMDIEGGKLKEGKKEMNEGEGKGKGNEEKRW